MALQQRADALGRLIRHQPARDFGSRPVRDHGLDAGSLIAAAEAVDVERGAEPLALERGVAGLPDRRRRADRSEIGRLVEGNSRHRLALRPGRGANVVVEAGNGDATRLVVEARHEAAQRVRGVGDGAAVAAGMEILGGRRQGEVEGHDAAAGDVHGDEVGPPLRTVRRENQVGLQAVAIALHPGCEMGAPHLLLALDHELEVDGQALAGPQEGFRHANRDEHRSLVVRDAAAVEPVVPHLGLEGRARPVRQRIGGLHVVVAVDQHRRRVAGVQPVGVDQGVALRRQEGRVLQTRALHPGRHVARGFLDRPGIGGVGADTGDADVGVELVDEAIAMSLQIPGRCHSRPPSTERVWPVIQPDCPDAKKRTAWTMSSTEPRRRVAMLSISAA